ncbi:hypothetical protein BaRGS_00029738 [Batillaria attramentaria]|uniref:Secreted protein n=1 Tax=Batillaria attramentaria TaxID=370345 RepID=A0ABD0JVI1_9CAEN
MQLQMHCSSEVSAWYIFVPWRAWFHVLICSRRVALCCHHSGGKSQRTPANDEDKRLTAPATRNWGYSFVNKAAYAGEQSIAGRCV